MHKITIHPVIRQNNNKNMNKLLNLSIMYTVNNRM